MVTVRLSVFVYVRRGATAWASRCPGLHTAKPRGLRGDRATHPYTQTEEWKADAERRKKLGEGEKQVGGP